MMAPSDSNDVAMSSAVDKTTEKQESIVTQETKNDNATQSEQAQQVLAVRDVPEVDTAGAQVSAAMATAENAQSQRRKPARRPKCKFYGTKSGCKAGESCQFRHDLTTTQGEATDAGRLGTERKDAGVDASRTVQRPLSQAQSQDPRTFQLSQIMRRFSPLEETAADGDAVLHFDMRPSDPDFPFDIDALKCTLRVPSTFPHGKRPTLRVTNSEMERGYQVNVEQGFDAIWARSSAPTLLNAMKALDKQLEAILTAQKAEMIKLVANASQKNAPPKPATRQPAGSTTVSATSPQSNTQPLAPRPAPISAERRNKAKAKREEETQILEHRLGRIPQFSKAADGTLFTIPVEPRKRSELPASLQAVKAVRLFVPLDYDIEPCTIEMLNVDGEATANVERAFIQRARDNPEATLLAQINYLAQNMHLMAAQIASVPESKSVDPLPVTEIPAIDEPSTAASVQAKDTERDHVKIIPRPPEWDNPRGENDALESDEDTSDYSFSEEEDDDAALDEAAESQAVSAPREKGILISLPGLELYGIELLELVLVNLTLKCERCKDTQDMQRIKPADTEAENSSTGAPANVQSTPCKKCTTPISVGYRKDIMHANSFRAGYLDIEGGTVVDLLPSTFIPTCADCSTPVAQSAGVVSVRGESSLAICRTCHRRMTFRLPEVKFQHVGGASTLHNLPLKPSARKKKETLGITAGTELPARGRCRHYTKSYRWFRFSCCNAVYPCDRCHNAAADHPHEFANRMICGWCSREQHYRPEDCGFAGCRRGVTGRAGSGFWEGGKGTRDRKRMSRKDPRKFKRVGGTASGGGAAKK